MSDSRTIVVRNLNDEQMRESFIGGGRPAMDLSPTYQELKDEQSTLVQQKKDRLIAARQTLPHFGNNSRPGQGEKSHGPVIVNNVNKRIISNKQTEMRGGKDP